MSRPYGQVIFVQAQMIIDHVRTARRSIAKHPLFSAIIVLSLGLAIS